MDVKNTLQWWNTATLMEAIEQCRQVEKVGFDITKHGYISAVADILHSYNGGDKISQAIAAISKEAAVRWYRNECLKLEV